MFKSAQELSAGLSFSSSFGVQQIKQTYGCTAPLSRSMSRVASTPLKCLETIHFLRRYREGCLEVLAAFFVVLAVADSAAARVTVKSIGGA